MRAARVKTSAQGLPVPGAPEPTGPPAIAMVSIAMIL